MSATESPFPAWEIETPHYMRPNEDCMGNPTDPYWRAWASHKTHVPPITVMGRGQTKEAAQADLMAKVAAKDAALKMQTV